MGEQSEVRHLTGLVASYGGRPAEGFGERIKAIRLSKGLSQADLSRMIGISPNKLCAMENGRLPATLANAFSLASALEVDIRPVAFPEPIPFSPTPFVPTPPATGPQTRRGSIVSRALAVIRASGTPLHVKDLANALEVHYKRVAGVMYQREADGVVVRTGKATWATPEIARRLQAGADSTSLKLA